MSTNLVSKEKLAKIRIEIDKALAEVAKNNGIDSVKIGTIRFDENGFRTTLEAKFEGGESIELRTLRSNASLWGFKPEIAGAKISYGNKEYTVTGIKRTKMTLEHAGKTFLAPVDTILNSLKSLKSPLLLDHSLTLVPPPEKMKF